MRWVFRFLFCSFPLCHIEFPLFSVFLCEMTFWPLTQLFLSIVIISAILSSGMEFSFNIFS